MNHWLVVPIVLPMLTAVTLIFLSELGRYGGGKPVRRALSLASALALLGVAAHLVVQAADGTPQVYRVGAWPAPFGIVLVLDRLAAIMVTLTALVAVGAILHAIRGGDQEAHYFHTLLQLQVAGLMGAFLTGDLFNLFVFFEILLIASYCLLVYGGTVRRVRVGVHYVVINMVGSALFLVAVGTLYGVTGTLNMADMAVRVGALGAGDAGLVRAGALLLLVVFALKAALAPLYFWLPNAYAAATPAVAALFAVMTKVGVYCIVRVYTLVFGADAGVAARVAEPWLLPAALATLALGAVGVLASRRLRRMQGYLLVMSVGTMMTAVAFFTAPALAAGLYYLLHSTLTMAAMFLVADLVSHQRGGSEDRLVRGPAVLQPGVLGALFFVGAVAAVGLPPLAGFIGKGLILAAVPAEARGWWTWGVVLGGSLMALVAMARAGSVLFWNAFEERDDTPLDRRAATRFPQRHAPATLAPAAALLGLVVLLTAFAGPVTAYTTAAAEQLLQPAPYIRAVLGDGARLSALGHGTLLPRAESREPRAESGAPTGAPGGAP